MSDVTQAVAAPVEVVIDGQPWRFAPLRYVDIGEIEQWMRDRFLKVGMDTLRLLKAEGFLTPEAASNEAVRIARVARQLSFVPSLAEFGDSPGNEAAAVSSTLLNSLEGLCRLFWLSLRREHPTITLESVTVWAGDMQTRQALRAALDRANSATYEAPGGDAGGKATPGSDPAS